MPQKQKTILEQACLLPSTEYLPLTMAKVTFKKIHNTFLNNQHFSPPTAGRRVIEHGFIFQEKQ